MQSIFSSIKKLQQPAPMWQQHTLKYLRLKFCRNHKSVNYGEESFMEYSSGPFKTFQSSSAKTRSRFSPTLTDNCELTDRDARSLDVNDLSLFELSDQHDFYARQIVRNATNRNLCVDGKRDSYDDTNNDVWLGHVTRRLKRRFTRCGTSPTVRWATLTNTTSCIPALKWLKGSVL